jgi:hypothetical protein
LVRGGTSMADETQKKAEIKDTDIVFDCPYCGKSLAIDYRGAGLTIPCTDCGKSVVVPIPDGMHLADIDSNEEEQGGLILNLRKSLTAAESRIQQLESEIEDLTAKRDALERIRINNMYQFGTITEKVGILQKALEDLATMLSKI